MRLHRPAAPATFAPAEQIEGGKGGEGGQPPLPPSNASFLKSVVCNVPAGSHAAVCSIIGDPTSAGWHAQPAGDVDQQCPHTSNNYFNCASFTPDGEGNTKARKELFSAFHVLVLDDVGTKVERSAIGAASSFEIETSPGNFQVGFKLSPPITEQAVVKRLQDAVIAASLCDSGANGATRWVRLPYAINGKTKHRQATGHSFNCRLTRWQPDVSYRVDELVEALGLQLESEPVAVRPLSNKGGTGGAEIVGDTVYTPAPAVNLVVAALKDRKLYKRETASGRHDVTCPWVNEHTDALDTGSAYFEPSPDYPTGGFCCQHSHGDRYHVGQLLEFLAVKPEQARGKARIELVPGEMNRIRRAAEQTLAVQGGYYQLGGAIVSVRSDPSSGDISTELLSEPALTSVLSDCADWYRFDGRTKKAVRCDPPARNVQSLLKAQAFEFLPPLTGLARQPFFRAVDGELVTTTGYDAQSGRYASFQADRFPLPEPTEEAAREALAAIDDLLDEFRFAKPEDRAATICAMLTAAVRPTLPVAPAFNITASAPGSGKSYLASTIVPFAGPGGAMKISYPTSAEEASKTMLSAFLNAPAAIVFDDMQTQWIAYGAINRMLTSDTITDRVLGVSRTVTVGTRALVMGTGNNIGPVQDMTRRVVTIRLHHRTATPALTRYQGNPAEVVGQNRGKFVSAALTIIAAYKRAGSPKADVVNIASYGDWSEMCRQPLLWLGLPDPATSLIGQLTQDPDQDALGCFLQAWHAGVGDQPVTLRAMIDESFAHEDLREAILDLPVIERGEINRTKLGYYLKRNVGRVVEGLELQRVDHSSRTAWRVVVVRSEEPAPG